MQIANAVVFMTGANRRIGLAFACEALARAARPVDAAKPSLSTPRPAYLASLA